jgi:hypothetical protein
MKDITQKDTFQNFQAPWPCDGDECGKMITGGIPVQWAPGSTGVVGRCCSGKFENEATVSADWAAVAHWPIIEEEKV